MVLEIEIGSQRDDMNSISGDVEAQRRTDVALWKTSVPGLWKAVDFRGGTYHRFRQHQVFAILSCHQLAVIL